MVTNEVDALVTWAPLPVDAEIWNFEDPSNGVYYIKYGVYEVRKSKLHYQYKARDGPFSNATFVRKSLSACACKLHVFQVQGFSVQFGALSSPIALMLDIASKFIIIRLTNINFYFILFHCPNCSYTCEMLRN